MDDDTDEHRLVRILLGKMSKLDDLEKKGEIIVGPEMRIRLNNLDSAQVYALGLYKLLPDICRHRVAQVNGDCEAYKSATEGRWSLE